MQVVQVARAVVVCGLLAAGLADADPPPAITKELPASSIAALAGCWRFDRSETWTFRRHDAHGLEVIRELADSGYADRARVPQAVLFDPKVHSFAFAAAGRIHGLMMIFGVHDATITADVYTSHDGRSYVYTQNTMTLHRC